MGIDLKLLKYVISRKIKSLSHSGIGVNRYRQKNCEVQLQKRVAVGQIQRCYIWQMLLLHLLAGVL